MLYVPLKCQVSVKCPSTLSSLRQTFTHFNLHDDDVKRTVICFSSYLLPPMDSEDDDAPNAAPEHVRIPANVPVYYLEELCEIIPTQVMYIHNDECWWNLAFFHDELARRLPSEERMNKFVKRVGDLLSQESVVEYVGQALYVKPSNTQPG